MRVSKCTDCGIESVPGFGMFVPCRYGTGAHHNIVEVDVDNRPVAERLNAAYQSVPWFDRERFDRRDVTDPARALLLAYQRGELD